MKKPPIHHFHVRLPKDLYDVICDEMHSKGGRSLNREIVGRLRDSTVKDAAHRIADALRPLFDPLDEADRERFAALAVEAVEILARNGAAKRSRRPKG
jgi:hypothetical protein